jgi:hypothetical protein
MYVKNGIEKTSPTGSTLDGRLQEEKAWQERGFSVTAPIFHVDR